VLLTWPSAHAEFQPSTVPVKKQPNGTPMNAAPALNTSG
jgi:hypothetical protein